MQKNYDLKGTWGFRLDKEKEGIEKEYYNSDFDDTILLPGITSAQNKGEKNEARETECLTCDYLFEGYAWYSKEVTLDEYSEDSVILLNLERTRLSTLWIDGKMVGNYDSLTTPHKYDISNFVKSKNFKITLLISNVDYPTKGGHLTSPDTQSNWNGIIGDISISVCPPVYISKVTTYPDAKSRTVQVKTKINNTTDKAVKLMLSMDATLMEVSGLIGNPLHTVCEEVEVGPGESTVNTDYYMGKYAELWSEFNPKVYKLNVCAKTDGYEADKEATHFGLRDFETDETRFLINGDKTFLRGKHDGLIFPLTAAFPTTLLEWVHVLNISKSYGINHYRYHTCCPPENAFLAADLVGIYMEPQLPFWGTLSAPGDEWHNPVEHNYLVSEGFKMLDYYGNHASFCMMSLGNELWGDKFTINEVMKEYRAYDNRHLYTQGSNNFQHAPLVVPEDDFYVGVRLDPFGRHFRGSYGMCDTPLGHIQTDEPSTTYNYDEIIHPTETDTEKENAGEEVEIQYGTGVKKVKVGEEDSASLIPEIPVVSHEVGQFAVYPNFKETEKYTGPLKAYNYDIFKERLEAKGMLDSSEDFFFASGKLSVDCYKEELESAARSNYIAGYQILDIQDFNGQGTALVGILDSLMESKGLVTPEKWRGFCSFVILMAKFDSYVLTGNDRFSFDACMRYNGPVKLQRASLHWKLNYLEVPNSKEFVNVSDAYRDWDITNVISEGYIVIEDYSYDLTELGMVSVKLPPVTEPTPIRLTLSLDYTDIENSYDLWVYPTNSLTDSTLAAFKDVKQIECKAREGLQFGAQTFAKEEDSEGNVIEHEKPAKEPIPEADVYTTSITQDSGTLHITNSVDEAKSLTDKGEKVLLLPYEVSESIRGFYCDDFWCYPMFRNICDWMKKPTAIGTMGLLIDNAHPALKEFASQKYSTPQWFKLISNADTPILDEVTSADYRPIVQAIDNFDRNHKLGLLFEGKVGNGSLLVCTTRFKDIMDAVEVQAFVKSITDYALSDEFAPEKELDLDKLKTVL
ncbi:MAG: beta-glucuronidase [Lachnospiraceae bacterium]|nr:beta-glucuronidase [Lachnospiraceae bacterium]